MAKLFSKFREFVNSPSFIQVGLPVLSSKFHDYYTKRNLEEEPWFSSKFAAICYRTDSVIYTATQTWNSLVEVLGLFEIWTKMCPHILICIFTIKLICILDKYNKYTKKIHKSLIT